MKHYQPPQVKYIFIEREDVIRTSGFGDGDVNMAELFGSYFGSGNSDTGGGN